MKRIPVLNELSIVVQSKDVNTCAVAVLRPTLVAVQDDEVSFRQGRGGLYALARIFARHWFEVLDKNLRESPVGGAVSVMSISAAPARQTHESNPTPAAMKEGLPSDMASAGPDTRRAVALRVSANYFSKLGVQMLPGAVSERGMIGPKASQSP